ncbi:MULTISPECIES: hypothetical protein [Nocardiopsis]|uniref:hypothetical protein n=1 Tax=Nocardiopsis TaxID=2013 RepID=UPI000344DBC5|nr:MULTISPECIES: hypothetical protein [Nocardiopsis]
MLKKTLAAGAVAAASAAVLAAGAPAFADVNSGSSGNGSVVSGNVAHIDANVGANGCGNATAILGQANGNCWNSGVMVING